MSGANQEQDYIFSYHSPADRVPSDHSLRMVKEMVNRALKELSEDFPGHLKSASSRRRAVLRDRQVAETAGR